MLIERRQRGNSYCNKSEMPAPAHNVITDDCCRCGRCTTSDRVLREQHTLNTISSDTYVLNAHSCGRRPGCFCIFSQSQHKSCQDTATYMLVSNIQLHIPAVTDGCKGRNTYIRIQQWTMPPEAHQTSRTLSLSCASSPSKTLAPFLQYMFAVPRGPKPGGSAFAQKHATCAKLVCLSQHDHCCFKQKQKNVARCGQRRPGGETPKTTQSGGMR